LSFFKASPENSSHASLDFLLRRYAVVIGLEKWINGDGCKYTLESTEMQYKMDNPEKLAT
jgi:hypothetical protein